MGEIGFPRREFLHDLKWWEVKSIIRGYNLRSRNMWSATRWSTYNIMAAFAGGKALGEAGIHSPLDLIKFPWDDEFNAIMSEEEQKEFENELASYKDMQF